MEKAMKKYYENIKLNAKENSKILIYMGVVLFACIAIIVMCNSYDTYERQNVNRIKLINEKPKAVVKEKITEKLAQKQTKEIKKNNQDKVSKNKETVYVIYNVNVRDDVNGKKIGYLKAGKKLKRIEVRDDGWSEVIYKGKKAYVATDYLTNNKSLIKSSVNNNVGINISSEDYYWLCQIVHAEAGNQDDVGKILVANTIFNRVKSDDFPDSVTEVIFQHTGGIYQFSPVKFGTVYSLHPDESTIDCVNRAINGESYSSEVMYFSSEHSKWSWHNTNLSYLFTHGGHDFYK